MSRYIDAEKINYRTDYNAPIYEKCGNHFCQVGYDAVASRSEIDEIPTADVAPVVHGHLIPKKEMLRSPDAKNYNCSACGKESFAYPNCPFCRSIMDEGVKEDAVH